MSETFCPLQSPCFLKNIQNLTPGTQSNSVPTFLKKSSNLRGQFALISYGRHYVIIYIIEICKFTGIKPERQRYIYVNAVQIVGVHNRSLKELDLSKMPFKQTFQL